MSEGPPRNRSAADWEAHYVDARLPWDTGRPDVHLPGVVERHAIAPTKAFEVGCGTGTNAIWLAQRGFAVTGVDVSPTAIEMAQPKLEAAGVECRLSVGNFLDDAPEATDYGFVYDRGVFHTFDDPADRERYAARVAERLGAGGLWHSLIGSTDGPPRDSGPPRRSARDVVAVVEPHFEFLELSAVNFDDGEHGAKRAWVLVARRR